MALAATSANCRVSLSFSPASVSLAEGSTASIDYTHYWCSGDPAFTDWVVDVSDTSAVSVTVSEGTTVDGTRTTRGSISIEALADDDFDDESVTVTFSEPSDDDEASESGSTVTSASFTVDVSDSQSGDGNASE